MKLDNKKLINRSRNSRQKILAKVALVFALGLIIAGVATALGVVFGIIQKTDTAPTITIQQLEETK